MSTYPAPIIIGKITLLRPVKRTVYHQHAADTDEIALEPQTVDLRVSHGDHYWLLATFPGTLAWTSRRYQVQVGQAENYCLQTQRFGAHIMESEDYRVELFPEWECVQVGTYGEGCGERAGKPMLAIQKKPEPRLFSVCYKSALGGSVSFYRYAVSREALAAAMPADHPNYDGYTLVSVS